jgi:hypothetical protein
MVEQRQMRRELIALRREVRLPEPVQPLLVGRREQGRHDDGCCRRRADIIGHGFGTFKPAELSRKEPLTALRAISVIRAVGSRSRS